MNNGPVSAVLDHLRKLEALQAAGRVSDGQLLGRFFAERDEAAFNVLLQRHGPMVWSVCMRVLHGSHQAEDVFQATFLTLARKPGSIQKQESIASWLYGVAFRLARQVRSREMRRPIPGQASMEDPGQDPVRHADCKEVLGVLDEELSRLGEQHRLPLVLCFLEGMTRDEAAEHLGWSLSTLKRRLDRGREVLRARLTRRGVTLSAALLHVALTQDLTAAAVPATLLLTTIKAAALVAAGQTTAGVVPVQVVSLVQGVVKTMLMTKLKLATALVLSAAALGTGAGLYAHSWGPAEAVASAQVAGAPVAAQNKNDPDPEKEKLQKQLQEARLQAQRAQAEAELAKAQATALALQLEREKEALQRKLESTTRFAAEQAAVAEANLVKAQVAQQEAQKQRAQLQAIMEQLPAKAALRLGATFHVRLKEAGPISLSKARLPLELLFTSYAAADASFGVGQMKVSLFDKNGDALPGGVVLHDGKDKIFHIKGGDEQTTLVAPQISLARDTRAGEEYTLVFTIGDQMGMVRFKTKK